MPLQHLSKSSPLSALKASMGLYWNLELPDLENNFHPPNPPKMNARRNHLAGLVYQISPISPPMWQRMCLYLPTMVFWEAMQQASWFALAKPRMSCYLHHLFLIFMPIEWIYLILIFSVFLHMRIWVSSPIQKRKNEFWVTSLRTICQKKFMFWLLFT